MCTRPLGMCDTKICLFFSTTLLTPSKWGGSLVSSQVFWAISCVFNDMTNATTVTGFNLLSMVFPDRADKSNMLNLLFQACYNGFTRRRRQSETSLG